VLPELHIGPLTLQSFGLMLALGFLASGSLIAVRLRELREPVDHAYEIVFAALVGGIVGAKLWYVAQTGDVGELFSGVGLVWYGGIVGGAVGVLAWAHRRGMGTLAVMDLCAAPLAIGYAVGRIGCQLAGDGDYGIPSNLPWAMAYPDGTVPTTQQVHPTPVYEFLVMSLVAYGLWRLRGRMRPGGVFAVYLLAAGTERFLIEFIRRNEKVALGLSLAQFVSLALMVAGAVWLARLRTTQPARTRAARTPA
jgi:phosphatidylglycerol---prolipoprotein diacylglyceryl transferase